MTTSAPKRSPRSPNARSIDSSPRESSPSGCSGDNARAYTKNKGLRELLWRRAIEHWKTKPYSPQTNGKVERLHQTMD